MMHHPAAITSPKITSKEPSPFYPLDSTGAISWDGSFDWPKRSGAITKNRPNDAPPQQPSPPPKNYIKRTVPIFLLGEAQAQGI
jgi:hypothetical protein